MGLIPKDILWVLTTSAKTKTSALTILSPRYRISRKEIEQEKRFIDDLLNELKLLDNKDLRAILGYSLKSLTLYTNSNSGENTQIKPPYTLYILSRAGIPVAYLLSAALNHLDCKLNPICKECGPTSYRIRRTLEEYGFTNYSGLYHPGASLGLLEELGLISKCTNRRYRLSELGYEVAKTAGIQIYIVNHLPFDIK